MEGDIKEVVDKLGEKLKKGLKLNPKKPARLALFNGADWLLRGKVPLVYFLRRDLGDRDKRMHLLASMLCELLREMKNQGSLRDVGEADRMVRDMVRNYGLITVAEAYPNETQKHHNGGQLWYWTQLGSVLQHFGDGDHFTKLMAKDQYYMRVLRTAIFKDVVDNFCTPGVDRILFQDFMLAFMSEVCGLLLKMMEDGYLSSHPLAVAALTAAREAYVDVIHFTWQPIYRPLLSMKNPVPEDSPLWLLRPEIPAMLVVPGMEEESKEGWKDTEGWEETEEEEEEVQGQEVAGEAMEVVEEEQGQG